MIYLDTSAAMKLVRPEAHSVELSRWFNQRPAVSVISSVLIEVELMRATRRSVPERIARASDVLRGIGVVTLSPSVIARAWVYRIAICGPLTPSISPQLSTSCRSRTRSWRRLSPTTSAYVLPPAA